MTRRDSMDSEGFGFNLDDHTRDAYDLWKRFHHATKNDQGNVYNTCGSCGHDTAVGHTFKTDGSVHTIPECVRCGALAGCWCGRCAP